MSESRKHPPGREKQRKTRASAPKQEVAPDNDEGVVADELPPVEGHFDAPETEGYTLQCFYSSEGDEFTVSFLEFPEIRVSDATRAIAVEKAEDKLHSQLAALRQSGQPVPRPIQSKECPTHLNVPVSQTLYRRLEALRYQERVTLEQLVTEVLTATVERKTENPQRQSESRGSGGGRGARGGNQRQHGGNRQGGGGHRGGRGGGNYDSMQSRENFMEYVRNLEKGGGYKKR